MYSSRDFFAFTFMFVVVVVVLPGRPVLQSSGQWGSSANQVRPAPDLYHGQPGDPIPEERVRPKDHQQLDQIQLQSGAESTISQGIG